MGPGKGLGWFGVGYNGVGYDGVMNAETEYGIEIKKALEARAAILRAELARTEALLSAAATGIQEGEKEPGEDSGG